jgi:hypothetical protein
MQAGCHGWTALHTQRIVKLRGAAAAGGGVSLPRLGRPRPDFTKTSSGGRPDLENAMGSCEGRRLEEVRRVSALDLDRAVGVRDLFETAATAGRYSALIGIVVPLAAGVLGRVTVSSPFLKAALTLLPSTATGRRTLRVKAPYDRSTRK